MSRPLGADAPVCGLIRRIYPSLDTPFVFASCQRDDGPEGALDGIMAAFERLRSGGSGGKRWWWWCCCCCYVLLLLRAAAATVGAAAARPQEILPLQRAHLVRGGFETKIVRASQHEELGHALKIICSL